MISVLSYASDEEAAHSREEKGEQGIQGEKGDTGETPVITVA